MRLSLEARSLEHVREFERLLVGPPPHLLAAHGALVVLIKPLLDAAIVKHMGGMARQLQQQLCIGKIVHAYRALHWITDRADRACKVEGSRCKTLEQSFYQVGLLDRPLRSDAVRAHQLLQVGDRAGS